jgi:Holliday junction DNA helicase RuvA
MIAQVIGRLIAKDLDRAEILTSGGVSYEMSIPLSVFEQLPKPGEMAGLHTHLVVREDAWELYGFGSPHERAVFRRALGAKGVGPSLALGLLSSLTADGLVRALRDKDVATLRSVPRVGTKKAQQLILDLADKIEDLVTDGSPRPVGGGAASDDAMRALISLGYVQAEAERAVRAALDAGTSPANAPELIRAALAQLAAR